MTSQNQTLFLTGLRTSQNGGTPSKLSEHDLCRTYKFSVQKRQVTRLRILTRLYNLMSKILNHPHRSLRGWRMPIALSYRLRQVLKQEENVATISLQWNK